MAEADITTALNERLFQSLDLQAFAILDGASVKGLPMAMWEHQVVSWCLFAGDLEPDMAEVAPYLIQLEKGAKFTQWVLQEGWGDHWGVFVVSKENIRTLRGHFRSLVKVRDEEGEPMFFRFYDPRVLRKFLATCEAEELSEVFGPTECFFLEAEDPEELLWFRLDGGHLKEGVVDLAKAAKASAGSTRT